MTKTNAMRIIEKEGVEYKIHTYDGGALSGVEVAVALGEDVDRVYKTLVTTAGPGKFYVFVIPVADELDLKKAALVSGEKSVSMLKSKELLGVTGYVHGGCSPVGMKKIFDTYIDESAAKYERITFSAGRIGTQLRVRLSDLMKVVEFRLCDLAK